MTKCWALFVWVVWFPGICERHSDLFALEPGPYMIIINHIINCNQFKSINVGDLTCWFNTREYIFHSFCKFPKVKFTYPGAVAKNYCPFGRSCTMKLHPKVLPPHLQEGGMRVGRNSYIPNCRQPNTLKKWHLFFTEVHKLFDYRNVPIDGVGGAMCWKAALE